MSSTNTSQKTFKEKVFAIVKKIQKGETRTYKQVATDAGNSNAARAVGAVLKTNFDPAIPCHRVIAADGGLRGYNRGIDKKRALLKQEGALSS